MKKFIKVREHTHVYEPSEDRAYIENTFRYYFREWWLDEMALTLALMIPGVDPIVVTSPESPFMKAAKDIWWFLRDDPQHRYWNIQTQPIYDDYRIGIVFIRSDNHRPEIKWYQNETTMHQH